MRIHLFLLLVFLSLPCESASREHRLEVKAEKLCFLGDMGTGSEEQQRVARALIQEGCDSVHFLGDLIYPAGIRHAADPEAEEKFLRFYRDLAPTPVYLIMGNHDYRGSVPAWQELAQTLSWLHFPERFYLLRAGDLCLLHLDSNLYKLPWHWGEALKQTRWLRRTLADPTGCRTTIALSHHPYRSRGHHGNASGLWRWILDWLVIGKVDFLISGHDHILSDEGMSGKTRLLVSGAAGNSSAAETPGYVIIENGETGPAVRLRRLD
jgi:3',5'-cyclic AMP phosphodiesterase CpdA